MSTPSPDPDETARAGSGSGPQPARRGLHDAQFAPGTILANRYRIASILGSGGMGEVYRADDIKLGQPVALKFLPARLARDPLLLARLHDEVRLGRQITHPNVCRIYDIVDWEGAHFVAMELVDGEDLSRLLRRIGRLPHDKAVDIARGVAAGLAAAHAKGILHRDLKPANVLIDSRGDARITDFGLALSAGDKQEEIAGTPAYMAPELLLGAPATIQSDLYALGLLLYELVTGRRAHTARTFPERLREVTTEITHPSDWVRDIDPAVERVILRCLARDPAQRPGSAREVIQALPGGDPLAAALAAGETPSPRIVAAAGSEGSLKPRVAVAWLALIGVLLTVTIVAQRLWLLTRIVPFDKPPEVLADRTRELMRAFGLPMDAGSVSYYQPDMPYVAWLDAKDFSELARRVRGGPPALLYHTYFGKGPQKPAISFFRDPQYGPGRTAIAVDTSGRLAALTAGPEEDWKSVPLNWSKLLDAAGLERSTLRPASPRLVPGSAFDARAAWSGTYPGDPTPVHVEAAAWRGVPVFFRVTGPWEKSDWREIDFGGPAVRIALTVLALLFFGLGVLLAWRNLRLRRGDRQGAFRVAAAVFLLEAVTLILAGDHRGGLFDEYEVFAHAFSTSLASAAVIYLSYIALEPFIRRRWPDTLIASTRLLSGNVRDPMVGRDILIGIAAGLTHVAIASTAWMILVKFAGVEPAPNFGAMQMLKGTRFALASIPAAYWAGITQAFFILIALVLLTMLLRRKAIAVAVGFVLFVATFSLAVPTPALLPAGMIIAAVLIGVAARYGLLAFAAAQGTFAAIFPIPCALDGSWSMPVALVPLAFVVVLALFAFRTSLGDQRLFSEDS